MNTHIGGVKRKKTSIKALIAVNIFTIVLAIIQGWDITLVLFIYWCQSIMIGGATVVKMLRLKKFSTEGYLIDEKPVLPTKKTKQKSATAFIIHYGAFHAAYLFVILNSFKEKNIPITDLLSISVIITLLFFLINHTYSYFINREEDEKKVKNIGTMMLFPYARIIPMHLAMMFGIHSAGIIGIIIFLPLKTFADTLMHNIEHYRKPKNIRIKKKVKSI